MIISIVNRSASISDNELQQVIRAVNRQIADDFAPYWSFGARLRLEGRNGPTPDKNKLAELRGDAVIYLWDKTDVKDALGYHASNAQGVPYGFVFTELSKQLGEHWSVTLSHEALELLGDAQGNRTDTRRQSPSVRGYPAMHNQWDRENAFKKTTMMGKHYKNSVLEGLCLSFIPALVCVF